MSTSITKSNRMAPPPGLEDRVAMPHRVSNHREYRRDATGRYSEFVNEALVELYRCPEDFAKFTREPKLSGPAGYFSLGEEVVGYGQCTDGSLVRDNASDLRDLSALTGSDGGSLRLVFDPTSVVDNLRGERYVRDGTGRERESVPCESAQRAYYLLRPWLGISVRKRLQRLFLRDWERLKFPKWPVDTSVEQILEKLLVLSMKAWNIESIPFIWFWPEGRASCVMLTHDVETQAGLEFSRRLMATDEAFGFRASFQVIPEGPYEITGEFAESIRGRGLELNIHDLRHEDNLFRDREEFWRRARAINRYVKKYQAQGFRSGRMYRNPGWYAALDISYDMSAPTVAHLEPQRGGCCTVFPYFIGRVLELPLTTSQDYSILHVLGQSSTELWERQIELVAERHGLVSFIVHPDYLMEDRAMAMYTGLLGRLAKLRDEQGYWCALPREVNHWWRQRNEMRLEGKQNAWRIVGAGSERARIAYATLDGDRVRYSMANQAGDFVVRSCRC
jgi:hypothetical protein